MNEKKNSKEEIKFNQEHFDFLLSCIKEDENVFDTDKWTGFKKKLDNQKKRVMLEGANLERACLNGVDLKKAHLEKINFEGALLEGAMLTSAHLERANFKTAHLEEANLMGAHLEGAILNGAYLGRADLMSAHLEGADLAIAHLEETEFMNTHLERVNFMRARLNKAKLMNARLEGANFCDAFLEGATLFLATVNGKTLFEDCSINNKTDTRGVGFDSCRFSPGLKQSFEYVNRRLNWIDWYKQHKISQWPVKFFWWCSDYGRSFSRIASTFFVLSFLFAAIYYLQPELIVFSNEAITHDSFQPIEKIINSVYFSIVTMTTLGFGDMYANPSNYIGKIVLICQVILGYVILGALITRLSISFNSDGPASPLEKRNKT